MNKKNNVIKVHWLTTKNLMGLSRPQYAKDINIQCLNN